MVIGGLHEPIISNSFATVYDFIEDTLLPPFGWHAFAEVFGRYRQERYASPTYARLDVLPFLTCLTVDGDAIRARPLAAAWACYILATQILDDVQDREGQSRIWSKEGPEQAVSLGLCTIGVAQMALARLEADSETQQAIGEAFGRVLALSAAWQTRKTPPEAMTVEQYFQGLTARTGLIFATGAWAGARIATPIPEEHLLDALYHFGLYLGIMGQIVDDCKDLEDDLSAGQLTLPVIYALSQKEHPCHPQLFEMLNGNHVSPPRVGEIATILREVNAVEWSLRLAEVYRQRAVAALEPFPAKHIEPLLAYVSIKNRSSS